MFSLVICQILCTCGVGIITYTLCFVPHLQEHIVATTLSILLHDRTLRGWEFLQRSGDTSSQLIADSAERYGLLVSEVLQPPIDNPEVIIRKNLGRFLFCDGSKLHT